MMLSVPPMCWALASGFVLARPASESPELLELDEDPELPEVPELPEPELPQAATASAHTAAIAVSRSVPAVLRVIFSIVRDLPRTCRQAMRLMADAIRLEPPSLFPVVRVLAGVMTSR
jgi:hypothetical protein